MHEVFRRGMTPCHVLPLRAIRVVLEIEMPHAIFIKHAIGVVHPAPEWGVMIERTIFFAVFRVKMCHTLHGFPSRKVLDIACRTALVMKRYIEQHRFIGVATQVQRHAIINVVGSQLHVECLNNLIVYNHF